MTGALTARKGIAVLLLSTFILSGCMSPKSYFFPDNAGTAGEKGTFIIADPQNTIMILWTPGSSENNVVVERECWKGNVPRVLRGLAGEVIAGKQVLVHGYCSLAAGNLWAGMSMAEARAPDIEGVIRQYEQQGVPTRQIFVAGQSMGGWAAVLVAARKKVAIGGIVVTAPANGISRTERRGPSHWAAYERQKSALDGIARLNGLVYVFHGDPYNSPQDLDFMRAIPGTELVALHGRDLGDGSCAGDFPHGLGYSGCFETAERQRILAFIKKSAD